MVQPARCWIRISLRELLVLVALIGVGCAALKSASSTWWTALSALALLAVMGFALVAALDRGARQAFALGFVICVSVYAVLLATQASIGGSGTSTSQEFDHYSGYLPTTRLLGPLFEAIASSSYHDKQTGEVIPNYDPSQAASGGLGGGGFGGMGSGVSAAETPERHSFMRIGHLLWSLLLGYVGGHVGRAIYLRRQ